MNNCNFVGRLTKEPELKATSSGKSVCNFSIAVDRGYKDSQGNRVADFIPCVAWDPIASLIVNNFSKGNNIGVTGRLESRSYEDIDGNKRTIYSILVNNIDFIQGNKAPSKSEAQEPTPSIEDEIQDELAIAYEKQALIYEDGEGGSPFDI